MNDNDTNETNLDDYQTAFIPGLFNTQLFENLSPGFQASIESQHKNIEGGKLIYGDGSIRPENLPRQFDTRTALNFPEKDLHKWFYENKNGAMESILTWPIDQAGCGSCWAFSTASQISDVFRFNLLRLYPKDAPKLSVFFRPNIICTGETNIATSSGVVNANQVKIYAVETYFNASSYFTVAFSPKIKAVGQRTILDNKCNDVLEEWKTTITTLGRVPGDLTQLLKKEDYLSCMGCQGNLIICPLMLFTGATDEAPNSAEGVALDIDFPLHEWSCLWASAKLREKFCSQNYLLGNEIRDFPKLYKADYYSYVTGNKPIPPTITKQGINTMGKWMMMAIYFYGPITIGFSVYQSFLKFFGSPANGKKIYTANQFMSDYRTDPENKSAKGGHAVVIVGWGESKIGNEIIPYWVVRNSWGIKWADGGYCKVERGIDAKINNRIPVAMRFEYEFGNLYFAPFPNPTVSGGKVNEMKNFLIPVPFAFLPAFGQNPELVQQMNSQCNCRCGYHYNFEGGKCELSMSQESQHITTNNNGINYIESVEDLENKKKIVDNENVDNNVDHDDNGDTISYTTTQFAGAGIGPRKGSGVVYSSRFKNEYNYDNDKSNININIFSPKMVCMIFGFLFLILILILVMKITSSSPKSKSQSRPDREYECRHLKGRPSQSRSHDGMHD